LAYGATREFRNLFAALVLTSGVVSAEPVVIAALGDSLTQGYGLAPEQGLVAQLQSWLDRQGAEVRLINAGVSGDTTAGGLARIAWTLTPDVQGVIVALGANDMLRGLDPNAARDNLDGILAAIRDAGGQALLVGFEAPGNFGPDYKATFDAAYADLAATYDTVYLPSLLAPLQQAEGPLTQYLQADGLHPTPQGVALIVDGLGPKVLELTQRIAP